MLAKFHILKGQSKHKLGSNLNSAYMSLQPDKRVLKVLFAQKLLGPLKTPKLRQEM